MYQRSKGHISFVPRASKGTFEYWARDGHIWRMDASAPVMPDGFRSGRWYGPDRADIRAQLELVGARHDFRECTSPMGSCPLCTTEAV